jgi:hypothetical protein
MASPGMTPPPIHPREVRPGRAWYIVAAMVAILGVTAGPILALVLFGSMFSLSKDIPAMRAELDARTHRSRGRDEPRLTTERGRRSPAGVGQLGAFGYRLVVPVGQPTLGQEHLSRGVGTAPGLPERLHRERQRRIELAEQIVHFGQ